MWCVHSSSLVLPKRPVPRVMQNGESIRRLLIDASAVVVEETWNRRVGLWRATAVASDSRLVRTAPNTTYTQTTNKTSHLQLILIYAARFKICATASEKLSGQWQ